MRHLLLYLIAVREGLGGLLLLAFSSPSPLSSTRGDSMIRLFMLAAVSAIGAYSIAQQISHAYGQLCMHFVSLAR